MSAAVRVPMPAAGRRRGPASPRRTDAALAAPSSRTAPGHAHGDASWLPLRLSAGPARGGSTARPVLQRMPAVSTPGDPFEREADETADKIMRTAGPAGRVAAAPAVVLRKCAACREEEGQVHARHRASSARAASLDSAAALRAAGQGGQPMPPAERDFFEARFGRDFGPVRVHTGAAAAEGARAVQARAYTVGADVVFGTGEYAPHTPEGRRVLAHELTHVVQQTGQTATSAPSAPLVQRLPFGIRLPSGVRGLDPAEEAIARGVYGASLDYSDVYVSDALGGGGRPFTNYLLGIGTVINAGPTFYSSPGSDPDLLIHELAHSWQSQHHWHGGMYMANSVACQAAAGVAGGGADAYCYVPGRPFREYAAEQIAQQVERREAPIVSHVAGVAAGARDAENEASVAVTNIRYETRGGPGVRC